MTQYILRRLLVSVPVLLVVTALIFSMIHLVPGDPVLALVGAEAASEDIDNMRRQLGLDRPLLVQYVAYLGNLGRLDFGTSIRTRRPVGAEIGGRIPKTLYLAFTAMTIAVLMGLVLGVLAAIYRNTWLDTLFMLAAIIGVSAPSFWMGLVLILVFAVELGWFPTGGSTTPLHVVLPALTLGSNYAAIIARVTRSSMLDVLGDDFIRTARAKGLPQRTVYMRHALKNALIPTITIIGLQFGALMAGSIVVEVVFSWPGLGSLLINALSNRDYPVVQTTILIITAFFLFTNLIVDLLYGVADPRVRYA